MKREVSRDWVVEVAEYLEVDPNNVKAMLIDPYAVYIQFYVKDENGLLRFDADGPLISIHSIPVIEPEKPAVPDRLID